MKFIIIKSKTTNYILPTKTIKFVKPIDPIIEEHPELITEIVRFDDISVASIETIEEIFEKLKSEN